MLVGFATACFLNLDLPAVQPRARGVLVADQELGGRVAALALAPSAAVPRVLVVASRARAADRADGNCVHVSGFLPALE